MGGQAASAGLRPAARLVFPPPLRSAHASGWQEASAWPLAHIFFSRAACPCFHLMQRNEILSRLPLGNWHR
jgi:hypothetical protein